ncbi:MAG: OsmC family peroxiredoxin [Rhodothermus sp.]|nr:OsmC family peroxiredoxin [Rhodothermus sp.]
MAESPAPFRIQARCTTVEGHKPERPSGVDKAPRPVEHVRIGVGGFRNVTAHLIAREPGFRIQPLKIKRKGVLTLDHLFDHGDPGRAGYKQTKVRLSVDATANKATLRKGLARIRDRWPVNDHLRHPTPVTIAVPLPQRKQPVS